MTDLDDILEHLRRLRAESLEAADALREARQQVEEQSQKLESPRAVFEYIDFFAGMFADGAADLERVISELPADVTNAHLEALRQLASNAALEQRRCLMFRDKWINRPLPYEQVRPLLNQISVDSRDQLTAYKSLTHAVERLQKLSGAEPPVDEGDKLDRRALFTRWFGK
jgi:hypothetical protein